MADILGCQCPHCTRQWLKEKEKNEKEEKPMMMSKELYIKCLNKDRKIFDALDTDVRAVFNKLTTHVQVLTTKLEWVTCFSHGYALNSVYRLHPETKLEPEIVEVPVTFSSATGSRGIFGCKIPGSQWRSLMTCACHTHFRGIVYTLDGKETTFVGVCFKQGIPIRVKFEKE